MASLGTTRVTGRAACPYPDCDELFDVEVDLVPQPVDTRMPMTLPLRAVPVSLLSVRAAVLEHAAAEHRGDRS